MKLKVRTSEAPKCASEPASSYRCPLTGYLGIQGYKRGCRCDGCKKEKQARNNTVIRKKIDLDGRLWDSQAEFAEKKKAESAKRRASRRGKKAAEREFWNLYRKKVVKRKKTARHLSHGKETMARSGCCCDLCEEYRDRKRKRDRKRDRERYANDPDYRAWVILRAHFRRYRNPHKKYTARRMRQAVGIPIGELWDYLERHPNAMRNGWTRENHGEQWEIDHIVPLAHFDPGDFAAFHYTNLQPLSPAENRAKKDRDGSSF